MKKNKKKEPHIGYYYFSAILMCFLFYKLGKHLLSIEWTISGWISLFASAGCIGIIIRHLFTGRRGDDWGN